jgi:NTE family protein
MEVKKVHLVLSCGGARGLANIGIIEVLEELGFEIISISGSSMGAVIGGIHASGFLPVYKEWMLSMTKSKVLGLFDFTLQKEGFIKGDKIFSHMRNIIPASQIEYFNIPFTAVATDVYKNDEKWFSSGDLFDALRATVAIPGIVTPFVKGEDIYIDGGILNPLPLNTVKREKDAIVLAVNVNDSFSYDFNPSNVSIRNDFSPWTIFRNNNKSVNKKSIGRILHFSYMMMLSKMTDLSIGLYKPDLVINIPGNACLFYEFYRCAEMIELGRNSCTNSQAEFKSSLSISN